MENCLFCKIVNADIPSKKILENDDILAFEDIDPKAPFHAIIIPKVHISGADKINSDNSALIGKVYEAAAQIAREKDLSGGFRIVNNCGVDAGQTVAHIHFHMLAGRNLQWPPG